MAFLLAPFRLLWQSLSDLHFYATRLWLVPTNSMIGYTLLFFLVFSLARTLLYTQRVMPKQREFWHQSWQEMKTHWPNDLTLNFDGTTLSAQPEQTLVVPYPKHWEMPETFPEHLALVFPERLSTDRPPQALMNISATTLSVTSAGNTESVPLAEAFSGLSGSISKPVLEQNEAQFYATLDGILSLGAVGFFFFSWLMVPLLRLAYLLIYALLGQFILGLSGNALRYRQMLHLGWWLFFPTELLTILWNTLYPSTVFRFAFWWIWLTFLLVIAWNYRGGRLLFLLPRKKKD